MTTFDSAVPGFVYACLDGEFVKIGWSGTMDGIKASWISCQVGNPRELEMRVLATGDRSLEAKIHRTFANLRIRGEWFRLEGDLASMIEKAKPVDRIVGVRGMKATKRLAASEWLSDFLSEGPVVASLVTEASAGNGYSRPTLKRAALELGVVSNPPGGGRGCTWALP